MNNQAKKVYLVPVDGRKSFYRKCYVLENEKEKRLYSYDTLVAKFINGKMYRIWGGYSVTTMRHINSFADYCGIEEGGKKWWDNLEMSN